MLSVEIRALVRGSVPFLKTQGEALTRDFYARLFQANPELRELFNQGHQHGGEQQRALAAAVLAYAEHIDAPEVLAPVIRRVAHKHASLGVRREHYAVVGRHLLAALAARLGEAATPALLDAWAIAYGQLADVFIEEEDRLYRECVERPGGWSGWRSFRVLERRAEGVLAASYVLAPVDGGEVPDFTPGQYVSVRLRVPVSGLMQIRQYSLSAAPRRDQLRITVKREAGGAVSNVLHDVVDTGGIVELSPPLGDFVLHQDRDTPVVLLSGGVGVTPMMSMLQQLSHQAPQREVRFVHACRDGEAHALRDELRAVAARHPRLRSIVHYEQPGPADQVGRDYDHAGGIDLYRLGEAVILADADYYLCGPRPFMRGLQRALGELGVARSRVHLEVFGSGAAD